MNQTVAIGLFGIVFLLMMVVIQLIEMAVELVRVRKLLTALANSPNHVDDGQEIANAKANIKDKLHRLFHSCQKSGSYDVGEYQDDNGSQMIHTAPPEIGDIHERL